MAKRKQKEPLPESYFATVYEDFCYQWDQVEELVHDMAKEKGWWRDKRNDGELIALMHSELSEALEGLRAGNPTSEKLGKPFTQAEEELADLVIRLMDMAAARGWNIPEAILEKVQYNAERPYRHGGKKF